MISRRSLFKSLLATTALIPLGLLKVELALRSSGPFISDAFIRGFEKNFRMLAAKRTSHLRLTVLEPPSREWLRLD